MSKKLLVFLTGEKRVLTKGWRKKSKNSEIFSGSAIGRNDGANRIAWLVDFEENIKEATFGLSLY